MALEVAWVTSLSVGLGLTLSLIESQATYVPVNEDFRKGA